MDKILLISWHPGYKNITAGGLVRSREIVKRFPNKSSLLVIDKYPSIYRDILSSEQILEYHIPDFIGKLVTLNYNFERLLEWSLSTLLIIFLAFRNRVGKSISIIYVPNSEMAVISFPAFLLHYFYKKRLVFCNGNVEGKTPLSKFSLKLSAFLHNHANYVITYSQALRTAQIKSGIKVPIFVNGVGLDLVPFTNQEINPKKIYDFIIVGRLVKEKGIFDLPQIFQELRKRGLTFNAVIVGEGSTKTKEELEKRFSSLDMLDSVSFTGAVSDEEKVKLYYQSKICIFPSYVEGWGIVPQEALAAGLTVVTYDLDVYKENIVSCPSVFMAKVGDVKEFAEIVLKLELLSEIEYQRLGAKGKAFVERFDWNYISQREYTFITQKDNYATL